MVIFRPPPPAPRNENWSENQKKGPPLEAPKIVIFGIKNSKTEKKSQKNRKKPIFGPFKKRPNFQLRFLSLLDPFWEVQNDQKSHFLEVQQSSKP